MYFLSLYNCRMYYFAFVYINKYMQYLYTHFANRIQFCEKGAFRNFAKFEGKHLW